VTTVVHFHVADIRFAVHGPFSAAELGIRDRLNGFLTRASRGAEDVTIRWHEGDPGRTVRGEMTFDSGQTWTMYRSAGGERFIARLARRRQPGGGRRQALVEANPTWDRIRLVERRSGPKWQSLIGLGAGELILRNRILFLRGLVFHACGVDDAGRGILLVGHSGSGKSTQARLWAGTPGVTVLSDDRVAVRLDGLSPTIHGTPWGGDAGIAANRRAPLEAVLVLGQARDNSIRRLSKGEAVTELAVRAFLPFWDARLLEQALATVELLATKVPVYALACRPKPDVIPLVRSIL